MDINEASRGLFFHHAQAQKEKLTGQLRITISYQSGGISKASVEKLSPLIPGAARPEDAGDIPGKNMG